MAIILKNLGHIIYRVDIDNRAPWHGFSHIPMLIVNTIDPVIFDNVMLTLKEGADYLQIEKIADAYIERYIQLEEKRESLKC